MPLAAPGTFADLSFFVLGDHALELKKQDVLRRLGSRRLQENDLDAVASKLIKHQDLIRIPATEAVGAVHEHDFNLPRDRLKSCSCTAPTASVAGMRIRSWCLMSLLATASRSFSCRRLEPRRRRTSCFFNSRA